MTYQETLKYLENKHTEWMVALDMEPTDKFALGMLTGLDIALILIKSMYTDNMEPFNKEGRP